VVGERIPAAGLRSVGARIFEPFDRATGAADRLFSSWSENTKLHERVARLESENARLRLMAAETPRLREQLGLTAWRSLPLKPVEVLALGGGEPLPWSTLSRATLLTDPNQAIACEVETTGVNGIVRFVAAPRPRLILSAVAIADTVRVGERVVTSDLSLRFPRGIPVGTVTRVDHDATGLMQEIEITPAARLARLRHAFVAPGPRPPADGIPRPKLEFEPDPLSGARPVSGRVSGRDTTGGRR
jgi:cell shape-determining protein MreC